MLRSMSSLGANMGRKAATWKHVQVDAQYRSLGNVLTMQFCHDTNELFTSQQLSRLVKVSNAMHVVRHAKRSRYSCTTQSSVRILTDSTVNFQSYFFCHAHVNTFEQKHTVLIGRF